MKAALYHGPRDIQVEELPMPALAADEVLVRVVGCGIEIWAEVEERMRRRA
jgi:NADPH:quinone reductase-like Zn-dependent oxidoreductase